MDAAITAGVGLVLLVGWRRHWWAPLASRLALPIIGSRLAARWGVFLERAYAATGLFFIVVAVVLAVE